MSEIRKLSSCSKAYRWFSKRIEGVRAIYVCMYTKITFVRDYTTIIKANTIKIIQHTPKVRYETIVHWGAGVPTSVYCRRRRRQHPPINCVL